MPTDVMVAHPTDAVLDRVAASSPVVDLPSLRTSLLDQVGGDTDDRRDADRAAHMMLHLDDPARVLALGMDHLVDTVGCERADAGLLDVSEADYLPMTVTADSASQRQSIAAAALPNRHPVLRAVWCAEGSVSFDRVEGNRQLGSLEPVFAELGTAAMLASPIRHRGVGIGLLCLDETEQRRFTEADRRRVDGFVSRHLAPLLAASLDRTSRRRRSLTAAEADAVALLADGCSYAEIARALGKSCRTIDNQLRAARRKAGATNAVDLVRWWNETSA